MSDPPPRGWDALPVGADFLSAADLSPTGWRALIAAAGADPSEARSESRRPLAGRSVALVFEHPSLRTRISSELAVGQLGGQAVYLVGADVGLGVRESAADVGRTLGVWVAAIVARTVLDATLRELAAAAPVPVINGLTDREHPLQALADVLTIRQTLGDLAGRTVVFVGDGNNVAISLAIAAAALGARVRIATPVGHAPPADLLEVATARAAAGGGSIEVSHADPRASLPDADIVYTDVWTSMGQEVERDRRRSAFAGYTVNDALMASAPAAARVMHCLPAHPGEEIDTAWLWGPRSLVERQAANRLPAARAVLAALVGPGAG